MRHFPTRPKPELSAARTASILRRSARRHQHDRPAIAFPFALDMLRSVVRCSTGSMDVSCSNGACRAVTNITLQLEHSIEADVSPSFAWSWRTDVNNWVDPPAQFQLDGPFACGSWGTTRFPGQEPIRWQIRDVRPGISFVIDMPLKEAVLSFEWDFEPVSNHRTRITQRIVLLGDNAAEYVDQVRAGFGSTLVDGMRRIAEALERAERSMPRRDDR